MKRVYLLTGNPGTGKTTIIKKVLSEGSKSAGGFYTEEIREQGVRRGFSIVTLDGSKAVLAHVEFKSPYKVGKYAVNLNSLEQVAVPSIHSAVRNCDLVVIDEIGRMEIFSDSFRHAVWEAIESGKLVLGTIMLKSHPWADKIKQHPAVEILSVERGNRQALDRILNWIESV